jgi:predicted phage gp36 major capsid-like protein
MRYYAAAIGLSIALLSCSLARAGQEAENAATIQSVAPDSGLVTWETNNRDVHLRLTQISPEPWSGRKIC